MQSFYLLNVMNYWMIRSSVEKIVLVFYYNLLEGLLLCTLFSLLVSPLFSSFINYKNLARPQLCLSFLKLSILWARVRLLRFYAISYLYGRQGTFAYSYLPWVRCCLKFCFKVSLKACFPLEVLLSLRYQRQRWQYSAARAPSATNSLRVENFICEKSVIIYPDEVSKTYSLSLLRSNDSQSWITIKFITSRRNISRSYFFGIQQLQSNQLRSQNFYDFYIYSNLQYRIRLLVMTYFYSLAYLTILCYFPITSSICCYTNTLNSQNTPPERFYLKKAQQYLLRSNLNLFSSLPCAIRSKIVTYISANLNGFIQNKAF